MRHQLGPLALVALAACGKGTSTTPATQPAPTSAIPAVSAASLKADLTAYAHDSMEGREAGTIGNVRATTFIAAQVKKLGLQPAGENGTYFQVVPLVNKALDPNSMVSAGGAALVMNKDFVSFGVPQLGLAQSINVSDVPSIYGGRIGDTTAALTEAQVEGKFVVLQPPIGKSGKPVWQFWQGLDRKKYAKAAGIAVIALDLMPPPVIDFLVKPSVVLKSDDAAPPAGALYVMMVTPGGAEKILGTNPSSMTVGTAGKPVTAKITMSSSEVTTPARNVVAILPGVDAKLKSEYVAIGAHNDHIGMSEPRATTSRRPRNSWPW
jgi:hypothetical protein